ncbi:MAG: hypothetical protein ACRC6I_04310 [Paracoccaceae bacterium]
MPFARQYSLAEVKGYLTIYRNNHAFHGVNAANNNVIRAVAGAHANIHAGSSYLDLQGRVNTPGQPRTSGTWWNEEDQAKATLELLNSVAGQAQLAVLDNAALPIGQRRAAIAGPVTPGTYRMANATDRSSIAGGPNPVLPRASGARVGAGSVQTVAMATGAFVLAVPGIAGQLQIQTSYPT